MGVSVRVGLVAYATGALPQTALMALAFWASQHFVGWRLPLWNPLTWIAYIVLDDFTGYWIHRAQHHFNWWWSLHSLHHAQRQMTMWSDNRNHLLDDLLRDSLLVILQDVDAEKAVLFEERQEMAALVDADEGEERVQGDGSEGIGGHPVSIAGSASDGDYGDAGGELAERVAKVCCGERSGCHIRSF